MSFTAKDIELAKQKGIEKHELEKQLDLLKQGNVFPELIRPARLNDGISSFSEQQEEKLIEIFNSYSKFYDWCRFIPASGAASRMFAFLVNYLNDGIENEDVNTFYNSLSKFPFFEKIKEDVKGKNKKETIEFILTTEKLNLLNLPKGLIEFHKVAEVSFTAVSSQLSETSAYSLLKSKNPKTHFTISEEHRLLFENEITSRNTQDTTSPQIDFSCQQSNTDTISIDENANIFRDVNGNLIFRPGGHGSLLSNLQDLEEDFIFIRNIDNVLSPMNNDEYVYMHQVMGGLMVKITRILFSIQKSLDANENVNENDLAILKMYLKIPNYISLKDFVSRPFRIAGMVKNSGEPGGGPFWIKDEKGESLQIIESSQVNKSDSLQKEIFESGTHFNPVDLCCCIKNYKGEKYNLKDFCNEKLSFLSKKEVDGNVITILEHPGLWNGSMHHWLTLFIEIPSNIFNPVKTINDLLRPNHQR